MSYILKLIRQGQLRLISRSPLLAGNSFLETSQTMKPLYNPISSATLTTSAPILSPNQSSPPPDKDTGKSDDIKYTIRLKKEMTYKELFKDTYSLYGPIFIATHISVSLISLGFWYSLVWLTVDPMQYLPDHLIQKLSEFAMSMTDGGSKFILAYGAHKITLPVRLGISIMLTKRLSQFVKSKRKDVEV